MLRAIAEYDITGIQTTLDFGKFVLSHEAFTSGNFDTNFVNKYFNPDVQEEPDENEALIAALTAVMQLKKNKRSAVTVAAAPAENNWLRNRKKY